MVNIVVLYKNLRRTDGFSINNSLFPIAENINNIIIGTRFVI